MAKKSKTIRNVGGQLGKASGNAVRNVIDATHLTAMGSEFTAAFLKSFRKELKKKK